MEVEESLKQVLGSEVNVAYHGGKGKLTVHFYSDEQLNAFANLLGQYQMENLNNHCRSKAEEAAAVMNAYQGGEQLRHSGNTAGKPNRV